MLSLIRFGKSLTVCWTIVSTHLHILSHFWPHLIDLTPGYGLVVAGTRILLKGTPLLTGTQEGGSSRRPSGSSCRLAVGLAYDQLSSTDKGVVVVLVVFRDPGVLLLLLLPLPMPCCMPMLLTCATSRGYARPHSGRR